MAGEAIGLAGLLQGMAPAMQAAQQRAMMNQALRQWQPPGAGGGGGTPASNVDAQGNYTGPTSPPGLFGRIGNWLAGGGAPAAAYATGGTPGVPTPQPGIVAPASVGPQFGPPAPAVHPAVQAAMAAAYPRPGPLTPNQQGWMTHHLIQEANQGQPFSMSVPPALRYPGPTPFMAGSYPGYGGMT